MVHTMIGLVLLMWTAAPCDEGLTWLKLIDGAEQIPHSIGITKQVITTSGGSERALTMKVWSADNGDLSLMVYTDPARVRGDKILQRDGGDNIWYYMKRRDVTRHFTGNARRQKVMGSDFSYEDLAQGDLTMDYTAEFLGLEELDGETCAKLRCTPTESGPSYDHLILWADEEDHLSRRIEYYDDAGHLKTLFLSDFQIIEERTVAMKLDMVNHRDGSHTLMIQETVSFEDEPDALLFTKKGLTQSIR